ncbi:hypothetical protein [Arenicella chitinivorans]|nr:hypothetical protein [Arenicella chitinivorans]
MSNNDKKQSLKLKWPWFVGGAIYGVFLRFIFDVIPSSVEGPMSAAFLIGTPLIAGALTIYGHRDQAMKVTRMIVLPWVTTLLLLLGTAIALLEGAICIAIMSPLFLFLASLGGLMMGGCLYIRRRNTKPLLSVTLLPFVILFAEGSIPLTEHQMQLTESVVVEASAERIWNEIVSAKEIKPDELPVSLSHLIGVPKPLEGINRHTDGAEIRYSIWEKGVNFEAIVLEREPYQRIKWQYVFNENSFPKGSMDDHVAIGGKYFDLHDTEFTLTPITTNKTELTIHASYRINSAINFYAVPASRFLGGDFMRTILGLYKNRSEK